MRGRIDETNLELLSFAHFRPLSTQVITLLAAASGFDLFLENVSHVREERNGTRIHPKKSDNEPFIWYSISILFGEKGELSTVQRFHRMCQSCVVLQDWWWCVCPVPCSWRTSPGWARVCRTCQRTIKAKIKARVVLSRTVC